MILPLVAESLLRVSRRPALERALDLLRRGGGDVRLGGVSEPAKALVIALAAATLSRPLLVLVESSERAEELAAPLRYFYQALTRKPARRVALLPSLDVLPYQELSPHPEILEERAVSLWRLAAGDAAVTIAPVPATFLRLRSGDSYSQLAQTIVRDAEMPQEELISFLEAAGYESHESVEMPGQFAVRGGIVDVFSPEAARPVRLELFGDTVESLREFDPETQRSTRPLDRATFLPLSEFPHQESALDGFLAAEAAGNRPGEAPKLGFAPGWEFRTLLAGPPQSNLFEIAREPVLIESEPEALRRAIEDFRLRVAQAQQKSKGILAAVPPERFYLSEEEWQQATQQLPRYHGNVTAFMAEIRGRLEKGEQVLASAASTGELERLADLCHEYEMPYRLGELEEDVTVTRLAEEGSGGSVPALVLTRAPLAEGVIFTESKLAIYGNADLFDTAPAPARPKARPRTAAFFSDLSDLKPGDFVVHVDHGIGKFEGLRQLEMQGAAGEFMLLTYAEEARLYVPLARLDLVQKYQSLGGATPQLDRLGSTVWETKKARVRKSVGEMAQKLLRLYAERKSVSGHAFAADSPWQREFEDSFEFEETADQHRAIQDVKRDLESGLPMDRLLCGDVGYGKTEVAMRAAFKVIADSKQAAILAPTTVLAYQHYDTFQRRFAAFPMHIAMLSRFRSPSARKKILQDLEAGRIDVVIGTHRLLSRDVRFHDLGLLVVDEEQRFGVSHKERIKELRRNVDVLTLSATPIPRTLHMSLVGLRDMSLIETAPKDRLAIQTVVAPFQESLIQRAIEEEMARQGQVFFVHNRVESIASLATLVQRLVPKARVVVGHGQMRESELEKVMMKFVRDEADVLVSTTIIENGLDIPRANTIIVNRADRFGLAELYQLRGRVGRSNQRAYAYLLVPPEASLSPIARQRLAALKEFSELGAGFRIAALDLELRGAGNLLGREQHGHIAAVGFDMYCQLLERAVAERKGEAVRPELHVTLNLGLDIRIPPAYIESENLRLRIYKRIAGVSSSEQREEARRELADRFGPPPPSIENLLDYAVLKALAEKLLVSSMERRGDQVAIRFHEQTPIGPDKLVRVIHKNRGLWLDPSGVLWVNWKQQDGNVTGAATNVLLQLQT